MARPTVLVTGGSSGIGAELARLAAGEGWFVWVAGRDRARLDTVVGELHGAGGAGEALELDLEDAASLPPAFARALDPMRGPGTIDALVNCAGIALTAPLTGGGELYARHMEVNFHGARRALEACLPSMRARGSGAIVNVASSAGLRGYAYASAYCASKHALLGYTRAAARELAGSGVGVSAVCPHYVDSPLTDGSVAKIVAKTGKAETEVRAFLASQNPGGRMLTTVEVAAAIWSLLQSRENGTILELDGAGVVRLEGPVLQKA